MRKSVLQAILSTWQMFILCFVLAAFTGWASFMSSLNAAGISFYNGEPEMVSPAFLASSWPSIHGGMAVLLALGLVYSIYAYVHVVAEEVTHFIENLEWEREKEKRENERLASDPYNHTLGYEGM